MTVSIITVVLNDRAGFVKTAQSVVEQDYSRLQWIVIDGGSIDGTSAEIANYKNRISLWVSEPDRGLYDAMNKGLHMATGDWVICTSSFSAATPAAVLGGSVASSFA